MVKKRILAVVTVKDNQVVQSIEYNTFLPVGKPEVVVKNLDRWQADEILINVIDRTKLNLGPDFKLLEKISKLDIQTPIIYGGGISSLKEAIQVTKFGADRILLESAIENNFPEFQKISSTIGSQSIIISIPYALNSKRQISFYDYKIKKEKKLSEFFIKSFKQKLFSEILLIDYKNQGTNRGFNYRILNEFNFNFPLILYGGVNNKKNIFQIIKKDKRVSALAFGNSLNYKEHSIQNIKSISKNIYFRKAYYEY